MANALQLQLPFFYIVGESGQQYNDDILFIRRRDTGVNLVPGVDWVTESGKIAREISNIIEFIGGPFTIIDFNIPLNTITISHPEIVSPIANTFFAVNEQIEIEHSVGTPTASVNINGLFTITSIVSSAPTICEQNTSVLTLVEPLGVLAGGLINLDTLPCFFYGDITAKITFSFDIRQKDYVYFFRQSFIDDWKPIDGTPSNIQTFATQTQSIGSNFGDSYKREHGRDHLNFLWLHRTPRGFLVDPATTNIHDVFVITRSYYTAIREFLDGTRADMPATPTPFELRSTYGYLLANKMLSDTVVLHSGRFRILFGSLAKPELQATFKIVRSANRTLTDNQIKVRVVTAVRNFFNVELWEFGETFFFTELSAFIHNDLPTEIDSVILVPIHAQNFFGDLFQVLAKEDEIIQPHITVDDVEVVDSFNRLNIRQRDE